jgi:hypothetical protein
MVSAVKGKTGYAQDHKGEKERGPVLIFDARETEPPADDQHQHPYNNATYGKAGIEHNRQVAAFKLLINLIICN